jgi:hypothetical protein
MLLLHATTATTMHHTVTPRALLTDLSAPAWRHPQSQRQLRRAAALQLQGVEAVAACQGH